MVFSSLIFLYAFFPLSLLACALCKTKKSQNIVLLISSLIFYAWGEPKYVLLLMFMALTSWICALQVEKDQQSGKNGKGWVALAAVIDISLIGFFKYSGLVCSIFGSIPGWIDSIALPIGISFYTFQLLTYVVDVYKGDAPAQKSYFHVLLYAALFHQCIAGPIVRYKTIETELFGEEPRKPQLARGVRRFCAGLGKKVLLANACGSLADTLFPENLVGFSGTTVLGAWLGLIAYALQIYLDFSAYSDMAIGMGLMLGFHYPENFNYPYISRSVTEFWRRWHMSLSKFFRDYVYIPLGGSRCSWPRMVLNTLMVWALTGLWHGASWNFVLWGLWFFVFLMIERAFLKKALDNLPIISNMYLLLVVLLSWVVFRCSDLGAVGTMLANLFGAAGNELSDFVTETYFKNNLYLLIISVFACLPIATAVAHQCDRYSGAVRVTHGSHGGAHHSHSSHDGKKQGKVNWHAPLKSLFESKGMRIAWKVLSYGVFPVVMLLLSTAALVGISYNPFLYFQF